MVCGCKGGGAGTATEYEVTTRDGTTTTVKTMAEVRNTLRAGGGGTYKAVGVKTV